MKRAFLNLLTGLSLLLCGAVCVLWVRSYWSADWITHAKMVGRIGGESKEWRVVAGRGRVRVMYSWYPFAPFWIEVGTRWGRHTVHDVTQDWFDPPHGWTYGGFGWSVANDAGNPTSRRFNVMVPLWAPAVLFSLLPAVRSYRFARRPRVGGLCASCGYDLRGNQASGRCPECGAPAPAPPPEPVRP